MDVDKETRKEMVDHTRDVILNTENDMATNEDGSVNVSTFARLNGPLIRDVWARCIVPTLMENRCSIANDDKHVEKEN